MPDSNLNQTAITVNGFEFSQELLEKLSDFFKSNPPRECKISLFQLVVNYADAQNDYFDKSFLPIVDKLFEIYSLIE